MITVLILKTWFMQLRSVELSICRSFCHSNFSSIARIDCEWRSKLTAPCEITNWHESTVLWTSVQLWLAGENQFISYSVYLNDISLCGCTPVCLLIHTLLSAVFQTQIWIRNHPHVHRQSTNKSADCIWYQVLNCGDTYTLTLAHTPGLCSSWQPHLSSQYFLLFGLWVTDPADFTGLCSLSRSILFNFIGAEASYYIIEFGFIMRAEQSSHTCDL